MSVGSQTDLGFSSFDLPIAGGIPSEQMEFRCSRCWNSNCVSVDLAGKESTCSQCGAAVTVPDATAERIERARQLSTSSAFGSFTTGLVPQGSDPQFSIADGLAQQDSASLELSLNPYEGYSPAGRLGRLVAHILDNALSVFAIIGGFVVLFYCDQHGYLPKIGKLESMTVEQHCVLFGPFVFLQIIQWSLLAIRGQTLGKLVCLIRVIACNGKRAGFFRAVLLREIVCGVLRSVVPFFGLVDALFIFSGSRRCIHDYLSGTRVVSVY